MGAISPAQPASEMARIVAAWTPPTQISNADLRSRKSGKSVLPRKGGGDALS